MQGRQGERREIILAYIDRASRSLTKQKAEKTIQRSGDDGWEAPPVPIPNTAVKLPRVESTGLEAAWEDRLLPVRQKPPQNNLRGLFVWCLNHYDALHKTHCNLLTYIVAGMAYLIRMDNGSYINHNERTLQFSAFWHTIHHS